MKKQLTMVALAGLLAGLIANAAQAVDGSAYSSKTFLPNGNSVTSTPTPIELREYSAKSGMLSSRRALSGSPVTVERSVALYDTKKSLIGLGTAEVELAPLK